MSIGLFFGSFNPIHVGHLSIAQFILNETALKKVRFVVSPQNPFKEKIDLIDAELRLDMVKLSIADQPDFEVSDVEFHLPQPSYTSQSLEAIKKLEPQKKFTLIMGSDTLNTVSKWNEPEKILSYPIIVYKRTNSYKNPYPENPNIQIIEAPLLDISATRIREMLKEKKEIKYLVRDEIINLLKFI